VGARAGVGAAIAATCPTTHLTAIASHPSKQSI
jgi:hypothetical protein